MDIREWDTASEHRDLAKWVALLARFNGNRPLKKSLIVRIEDYFVYYWSKNRLSVINSASGERFMSELPDQAQE